MIVGGAAALLTNEKKFGNHYIERASFFTIGLGAITVAGKLSPEALFCMLYDKKMDEEPLPLE